ncbi:cadherin-like protein 26 [Notolabrus celidotus]|uniref:cadherin-like protein 26 n=1 Tax=Notolabrus celidotus TaxID=1203425 RepID=UPI0014902317|nr:cadherin-like protein 26 [Notolabrus celidotus]
MNFHLVCIQVRIAYFIFVKDCFRIGRLSIFQVYCFLSASCSEMLSRHRRAWIINSFNIEEEHPGPFPYVLGMIKIDRDFRVFFDLTGEGVEKEPKGVISINKESGMLYVHKPVDYEERTVLKLKFDVKKTDLSIDTNLGVHISILDINDNPPRFQKDLYEISVKEEDEQGSHLLTVLAYDRDQRGSPNSTFHYEIKSVSPKHPDTEFFIDEFGKLSFRGCLDHEVAEMFTVLVEAKDHGDVVSLSSSTTVLIHVQDGNNHLPTISGLTGSGKVKEDETGVSPLRLHVTDKDSPHSPAWRARFTIQGEEQDSFKIETDPTTNDGVLTVAKPLDFEDGALRELLISVENELPYFSCKMKQKTTSGLWKVDTTKADDPDAAQPHSVKVIIEIEDINDPPVFSEAVKEAMLKENAPTGTWVERVTAADPDSSHAREFVYMVGHDPAGWMMVDPHTGDITTVQSADRESPHVDDGVYTIILHAVDDGNPPLTGTTTLNIHVIDQNDNIPQLTENILVMCVSDSPTTNITAFDLDGNPFGGPFTFELLGDISEKWTLNPSHGYTAGLGKGPGVYVGPHTVDLKVSDLQGQFGVYSLNVTVCDCSVTPNCLSRRGMATHAAFGAIGILLSSLLLLLFFLLMAVVVSCKKEFTTLQTGDSSGETLLVSNIEKPGTDCKVPDGILPMSTDIKCQDVAYKQSLYDGMQQTQVSFQHLQKNLINNFGCQRNENLSYKSSEHINQIQNMDMMNSLYKRNSSYASNAALLALLHQRLSSLHETEEELLDYEPHLYADEGESDQISELEDIMIPDQDSLKEAVKDLGPKFNQLASICRKSQREK